MTKNKIQVSEHNRLEPFEMSKGTDWHIWCKVSCIRFRSDSAPIRSSTWSPDNVECFKLCYVPEPYFGSPLIMKLKHVYSYNWTLILGVNLKLNPAPTVLFGRLWPNFQHQKPSSMRLFKFHKPETRRHTKCSTHCTSLKSLKEFLLSLK